MKSKKAKKMRSPVDSIMDRIAQLEARISVLEARLAATVIVSIPTVGTSTPMWLSDYDPCASCSNSVRNGGSGICICSLPNNMRCTA